MRILSLLASVFTSRAHGPELASDAEAERLKAEILSQRKVTPEDREHQRSVARQILWRVWVEKFAAGETAEPFEAFARGAS